MLIEREDFICEELDFVSAAEARPWRFACVFYFHFLSSSAAASCNYKQYEKHSLYTDWDSGALLHIPDTCFMLFVCYSCIMHIQAARANLTSSTLTQTLRCKSHLVSVSSVKFYRNKLLLLFCKSCNWTLLIIRVRSSAYWFMWHVRRAVSTSFMCYKIISPKSYEPQPRRSANAEPQPSSC